MGEDFAEIILQTTHYAHRAVWKTEKKLEEQRRRIREEQGTPSFRIGQRVFYKCQNRIWKLDPKWISAVIVVRKSGPIKYHIRHYSGGRDVQATVQQLRENKMIWTEDEDSQNRDRMRMTTRADYDKSESYDAEDETGREESDEETNKPPQSFVRN
jgi:hypothetical protein